MTGGWLYDDPKGGKLYNPRSYNTQPKGINFTKEQTEYQLYPEEYFAAADCSVYFADVWMDELTSLQFRLTENVKPLFSYGSKTWDYVMRGSRLVEGSFRIAFKEAGYMFVILDHIGQQKKQSPALGYLMNGEKIPMWHGQIQQNIEEILHFWHEQGQKMPDKEHIEYIEHSKQEKWLYNWPNLRQGATGKANSMVMWKNKGFNTAENRHGTTDAIKQLQSRLIELGMGWPAKDWSSWGMRYSGDSWKKTNINGKAMTPNINDTAIKYVNDRVANNNSKIGKNSGNWYLCQRYYDGSGSTIGGSSHDAYSAREAALQQRLDDYPDALKNFWMGGKGGRYDGKYGDLVVKALNYFIELAEWTTAEDGSKGRYLSKRMWQEIQKGLAVTGEYDVPTKLAVTAFQGSVGIPKTGYVDYNTMWHMAPMRTVTWKEEKRTMIEGEIHKDSSQAAESRMVQYEKEIWGRPFSPDAEKVRKNESFFYRGRLVGDNKDQHTTQWLYQNGIDIYINYGPIAEAMVNKHGNAPDRTYKDGAWYPTNKSADIGSAVSFNTTVKAIRNVQIYDVQQILDPTTGDAIEEEYLFLAKDLD